MKSRRTVFVDTGAHFAVANKKDPDHCQAKEFLTVLAEDKAALLVTNFIVSETYTLLLYKVGRLPAVGYIEDLKKSCQIIRVTEEDEERAWAIILKYKDKAFSYVDATSFAVMERLGVQEAFAFDAHFKQYGFVRLP